MYKLEQKTQPDKSTWEFIVVIPKKDVKDKYDQIASQEIKNVTVDGFRKGKAPKNIAEKQLDVSAIYDKTASQILEEVYSDILKKHSIKPIMSPKIEIVSAKENEDWKIKIITATKPDIDIKKYKEIVKKLKDSQKSDDIWVPGKDKKVSKEDNDNKKNILLNKILNELIEKTDFKVPTVIVETELNKRLSKLVDDVSKAGLTMDQYLSSKKQTIEDIKKALHKEINDTYKLEFILESIAQEAKITVEKKDLDEIFSKIADPQERTKAENNSYFYASILRRQKTLDHLLEI